MNVLDTLHKTVHNPKHGGAVALSARMGMTYAVLNSKANPNVDTHHWRLDEALSAMTLTDDHSGMEAMAYQLGGVYYRLPEAELSEEEFVVAVLLDASAKHGQVCQTIGDALNDGVMDESERTLTKVKIHKLIARLQQLAAAME